MRHLLPELLAGRVINLIIANPTRASRASDGQQRHGHSHNGGSASGYQELFAPPARWQSLLQPGG
jgi:hypothetical protein